MGKGFAIPVRVGKSGGVQKESGTQHLFEILKLALSGGEDDNPFQSLGIAEQLIFQINDSAAHGRARYAVQQIINKFSDRVALDPSTPISFEQTEEGELELSFRYIDLDTNEVNDFNEVIG
jgi:hypothetical protein